MEDIVRLQPPLFYLIDSLRGIGYTIETAIADLIDNCIAAEALKVEISFVWANKDSHISIFDDGCGMSESELIEAMNLAQKGVNFKRGKHDLGRFGLGLKTASFSQCKILTVSSKKNEESSSFRWDLNALEKASPSEGLFLIKGSNNPSLPEFQKLRDSKHGTLVIWEDLDKVVSQGLTYDHFCNIAEKVSIHLSMVFHRYIEQRRLKIFVDDKEIGAWNPFPILTSTIQLPEVKFGKHNSNIAQGYILPHKDYIPNETTYVKMGGQGGWISQQGYYVYRNDRLLVAGSWLGLGSPKPWIKDELHGLARIKIDITNSDDFDWSIDVKKSTAKPPADCRLVLERLGESIRAEARKVYVHRGKKTHGSVSNFEYAWIKDGTRYRVNRAHSIVNQILNNSGDLRKQVEFLISILEESVPVERIWLDTAEHQYPQEQYTELEVSATVLPIIEDALRRVVAERKLSIAEASVYLLNVEPFDQYPEAIEQISKKMGKERPNESAIQ
nr:ATP-binding protein [uncultured Sphaerochaeta sp.]